MNTAHVSPWEDIRVHEERFAAFATSYLAEHPVPMLQLKQEHTRAVLKHARALVRAEGFTGEEGRAALLAALYHDVGRFPQYVRWKTFSDAQSENHARLSVRIIKQNGLLCNEPESVVKIVLSAVALHNKYRLPKGLSPSLEAVAHLVRDADKLDILRIMAQHLVRPVPTEEVVLHVKDEPSAWTPSLAAEVLAGQVPSYTELRYVNDFRLLLGSWVYGLHYDAAKVRSAKTGHIETVLAGLPDAPELEAIQNRLLAYLHTFEEKKRVF